MIIKEGASTELWSYFKESAKLSTADFVSVKMDHQNIEIKILDQKIPA